MYGKLINTPPATDPVTLSEAKTHLAIPASVADFDSELQRLYRAAVDLLGTMLSRNFIQAEIEYSFGGFPIRNPNEPYRRGELIGPQPLYIPEAPVLSVDDVQYFDPDGALQTLTGFRSEIDEEPAFVLPPDGQQWPAVSPTHPRPVIVKVQAGYGAAPTDIPNGVKLPILQLTDDWFNDRSAEGDIGQGVMRLIGALRWGDDFLSVPL